jgi:uncharacterized protein (TIGR02996 family)
MNEAAFHAALRENPSDELTWQALADWLEEDGQADRAELLRLTRRMLPTPVGERGDMPRRYAALLEAGVRPVLVEWVNSIGMRFALVPAGRFLMGSPEGVQDRMDDEALHEVQLTRPFWLGVFPVTQAQWKAVMGNNPAYFSRDSEGKGSVKDVSDAELDLFPVESVSWSDTQTFLKKLAQEEAKGRREYRFPTEAEWEYACRAGTGVEYAFCPAARPTRSLCSTQANFDGESPYGGAEQGPVLNRTSRVGSYEANPFGLYDMHGNVQEWCSDWWGGWGNYSSTPATDPPGPTNGLLRMVRGGSWREWGRHCRAASRLSNAPSRRDFNQGFRAAAVAHE